MQTSSYYPMDANSVLATCKIMYKLQLGIQNSQILNPAQTGWKDSLYPTNPVQPSCSESLTGGPVHGRTLITAVISRTANRKSDQASTALSLIAKNLLSPTVLKLTTPYVELN
eukprot:1139260-Pelagomonas_calceolata.AAC.7